MGRSSNKAVFLVAFFSTIGGFLFGYDTGMMSSILVMKSFDTQFHATSWQKGFMVSALQIGALVGSFIAQISDAIGRKQTIIGGSALFLVGAAIQTTSFSLGQFYAGRVVGGLATGVLSMVVPLYISELAPKRIRGRLVALQQLAITLGIAIGLWIGFSVKNVSNGWRIVMGIQIAPAIVLIIGMFFLPNSPRWILDHFNDRDRAYKALQRVRDKKNVNAIESEMKEIEKSIEVERSLGRGRYVDLFRREMIYPLSIGILVPVFQQLTGINAIMYYAPKVYETVTSIENVLILQGVMDVINFVATFPAIYLVDRAGRKKLLMSGAAGMCACFIIVFALFAAYSSVDPVTHKVQFHNAAAGYVMVILVYLFVVNFAYSWGPIAWIIPAEIFPLKHRARAIGITTAMNWLANIIVSQFTPVLFDAIYYYFFLIFVGLLVGMFAYVYFFVPETKGKSLEQIERMLARKNLDDGLYDEDSFVRDSKDHSFSVPVDAEKMDGADKDEVGEETNELDIGKSSDDEIGEGVQARSKKPELPADVAEV